MGKPTIQDKIKFLKEAGRGWRDRDRKSAGYYRGPDSRLRYCRGMKLYDTIPQKYQVAAWRLVFEQGIHEWEITPMLEAFTREHGVNVGFAGKSGGHLMLDTPIHPNDLCEGEIDDAVKLLEAFDDLADSVIDAVIEQSKALNQSIAYGIAVHCASLYDMFDAINEARRGWDTVEGQIKAIEGYGAKFDDGGDALAVNAVKHLKGYAGAGAEGDWADILTEDCGLSEADAKCALGAA